MKRAMVIAAFVFLAAAKQPTVRVTGYHELTIGDTKIALPYSIGAVQDSEGNVSLQTTVWNNCNNTEKMVGIDYRGMPICAPESASAK